jgi:hypothetical protein
MTKATKREYLVVSDDSIRMYLDSNPLTKGKKGGFAVGGFDMTKGAVQNYFDISADSIRMYIDDNGKGKKGGFAVGGFDMTKGEGSNYLNVATDPNGIINPAQNRILWYPLKNAFLTGGVLIERPDSVGKNSFASGFESKAKGQYSQALGYQAVARGNYSTAIGQNAVAHSSNSYAFGKNALARGIESFAFGSGSTASGMRSFSFGSVGIDSLGNPVEDKITSATGTYSIAMGLGATADKKGSMSFGVSSQAGEEYSLAIGYSSQAVGKRSLALGSRAGYSEAVTYPAPDLLVHSNSNYAKGDFAMAIGSGNTADAGALAIGLSNNATKWGSIAMGFCNKAYGDKSVAAGYRSEATGNFAAAIGNYTTAQAFNSFVVGSLNVIAGSTDTWVATDPLFVVGNGQNKGTSTVRSNAFIVMKNGTTTAYGNLTSAKQVWANNGFYSDTLMLGNYHSSMVNTRPYIRIKEYKNFPLPAYSKEYKITVSGQKLIISDESSDLFAISGGNIGIGTNTPGYKLDVNGEITSRSYNALRLRQSSYSTIIRNDNSVLYFLLTNSGDPDGTWNGLRPFYIDLTSGNVGLGGDALVVKHGGNVGIGTTSPSRKLHVSPGQVMLDGTTNPYLELNNGTYQGYCEITSDVFGLTYNSAVRLAILSNGNVGIGTTSPGYKLQVGTAGDGSQARANAWNLLSDIRLKTNFAKIIDPLGIIASLKGFYFNWNLGTDKSRQLGLSAQDVVKVLPEIVSEGTDGYLSVEYSKLTPVLIEAVKEQQKIIEKQDAEIQSLKYRLNQIEVMLAKVDIK